jgi:hypothetical protein
MFWRVLRTVATMAAVTAVAVALLWAMMALAGSARAHDAHLALSVEDQKIYEFYAHWMRPKGNFAGMAHRGASCCNKTDCFPVVEIRLSGGRYSIRVQTPRGISPEYRVDPAIIESNQTDPRESPDGKSHACIIGGMVACFVEGSGI